MRRAFAIVVAALVTAAMAVVPSTALADPGGPRVPITVRPCAELGPIDWWFYNSPPYAKDGVRYIIISATPTFDTAHSRFVQNNTDQTISGTWTASETRTVSLTHSLNVSIASPKVMGASITLAAGVQAVQSRSTQIGVSATSPIPAHRTMLGEYGLNSLDVVMDVQVVAMRKDLQTCEYVESNRSRHTAHAPTVNEGWRFTLS
ncbi:hypothetical protein HII36_34955 [Nonomuraea sp. NN258]|uniref:hypothetical protein n=1 Tax=Nonomuraea antri TaxID=2730852 RepID=UPI001568952D|nr:hypothetical protein [Nonomuraea antri]NRQ37001.1 hypothetical protein [Nonomuraea antri]